MHPAPGVPQHLTVNVSFTNPPVPPPPQKFPETLRTWLRHRRIKHYIPIHTHAHRQKPHFPYSTHSLLSRCKNKCLWRGLSICLETPVSVYPTTVVPRNRWYLYYRPIYLCFCTPVGSGTPYFRKIEAWPFFGMLSQMWAAPHI